LHNAAKYSGANRFWVELCGAGNEVRLEAKDAGIGFHVNEAHRIGGGLGLVSMQERVRAVNGRFYLESKPGAGTKIIASVPVAAGNSAGEGLSDDTANIAGQRDKNLSSPNLLSVEIMPYHKCAPFLRLFA
jgi:signal transduction histidine kinase